jgi:hypothetical protein
MLGFSTLASSPLGDDGGQLDSSVPATTLFGDSVAFGSPVVGEASLLSNNELYLEPITTLSANVSGGNIASQGISITLEGVVLGTPLFGQPAVGQTYAISVSSVQTAPVSINDITLFKTDDIVLSVVLVGTPVVTSSGITQTQNIPTQGVVSTAPRVGLVSVEQIRNFIATPVLTEKFVVEDVDSVITYGFDVVSVTFSPPLVGISFLNGSKRRVVDVTEDARNYVKTNATRNYANTNTTSNGVVLNVVYN